jgi:hypothetical protein
MSWSQKLSLPESHGKGANDLVSLGSCEGVKEDVVADTDRSEVLGKTVTQPSVVVVCASCNCSFTGSFSSNEVSHKLISLGIGVI